MIELEDISKKLMTRLCLIILNISLRKENLMPWSDNPDQARQRSEYHWKT